MRRTEVAPQRPDPAELDHLGLNTPPKVSNSGRGADMDTAQIVAVDGEDLGGDVCGCGLADGVGDGLVEVQQEHVRTVAVRIAQRGVVSIERGGATVVIDADGVWNPNQARHDAKHNHRPRLDLHHLALRHRQHELKHHKNVRAVTGAAVTRTSAEYGDKLLGTLHSTPLGPRSCVNHEPSRSRVPTKRPTRERRLADNDDLREQIEGYIEELAVDYRGHVDHKLFTLWFMLATAAVDKPDTGLEAITDRTGDKNLDAIHINETTGTVYLIQSKFREKLGRSEPRNDVLSFVDVARSLWDDDRFASLCEDMSEPVADRLSHARERLEHRDYRLQMIYSTLGKFSEKTRNEAERIFRSATRGRSASLGLLDSSRLESIAADYEIGVAGLIEEIFLPVQSNAARHHDRRTNITTYLFAAAGNDIADIYRRFGLRVFDRNIRGYLGEKRGSINEAIRESVEAEPEFFLHYNNGVTLVCESANLQEEGDSRKLTMVQPQIINGQQTTRALAAAGPKARRSLVQVRVMTIPRGLNHRGVEYNDVISNIVRASNSQTKIDEGDLRSTDPTQVKLERELRRYNYLYVRKKMQKADEDKLTYSYLRPRVSREDLTRAVSGCKFYALPHRVGRKIYTDEHYGDIIRDDESAEFYLCCYWTHKRSESEARKIGTGDAKKAVWVSTFHCWQRLGDSILDNAATFIRGCEQTQAKTPILKEFSVVVGATMEGALHLFAKKQRASRGSLTASNYFRQLNSYDDFVDHWPSVPKRVRERHSKAEGRFLELLAES